MILISSSIPIQADEGKYHDGSGLMVNVAWNNTAGLPLDQQALPAALPAPALSPETRKLLRYVGIQVIDQALHFVIAAGPIWASRYLVGVPWYGWLATPLLAYREWRQWPSNRWWDPPLDWTFLTLGVVVATWGPARRRTVHRRGSERVSSTV